VAVLVGCCCWGKKIVCGCRKGLKEEARTVEGLMLELEKKEGGMSFFYLDFQVFLKQIMLE